MRRTLALWQTKADKALDLTANMVGKAQAKRCANHLFGVLQVRLLNQHIALSILDEVLNAMFPELTAKTAGSSERTKAQPSPHMSSSANFQRAADQPTRMR